MIHILFVCPLGPFLRSGCSPRTGACGNEQQQVRNTRKASLMSTSGVTGRKSGITRGSRWSACPVATASLLRWTAGPARKSYYPGRGCIAQCCCWTSAEAWTREAKGSVRSWTGPPACCWTGSGGRHTGTEDHSQHRNTRDTSETTKDGKSLHFRSSPHRPPT